MGAGRKVLASRANMLRCSLKLGCTRQPAKNTAQRRWSNEGTSHEARKGLNRLHKPSHDPHFCRKIFAGRRRVRGESEGDAWSLWAMDCLTCQFDRRAWDGDGHGWLMRMFFPVA